MILVSIGAVFMGLFMGVSLLDLAYFHLWKYRLFQRVESRQEHLTHGLRAVFFVPILYLLLGADHAGVALWALIVFVALDQFVEAWDVLIERRSRRNIGGLTSIEYFVHVLVTTLRVAGIALVLAAKPGAAWSLSAPSVVSPAYPGWLTTTTFLLLPGAALIGVAHLWLLLPRYREKPAPAVD